ncbi:MAG: hypothetical protein V2A54_12020 [Bacteroidota bacterium]
MIRNFFLLDIVSDFRKLSSIAGLILFIGISAYLVRLSFPSSSPDLSSWNAIYWIILTFAALGAASRLRMSHEQRIFILTLASPRAFILARMLYNTVILISTAFLLFLLFYYFFPLPEIKIEIFLLTALAGSCGLSAVLTFSEALSSLGGGSFVLSAVIGIPLCIPLLVACSSTGYLALNGQTSQFASAQILLIFLISLSAAAMSALLYPFLCKD